MDHDHGEPACQPGHTSHTGRARAAAVSDAEPVVVSSADVVETCCCCCQLWVTWSWSVSEEEEQG